jgi:hypothetical protein
LISRSLRSGFDILAPGAYMTIHCFEVIAQMSEFRAGAHPQLLSGGHPQMA